MEVDAADVDFTRGSNGWQSWVRAINLATPTHANTSALVKVYVREDLSTEELCPTKVAYSPLCEYVLRAAFSDTALEYECCPHGAAVAGAATCPAVPTGPRVQG